MKDLISREDWDVISRALNMAAIDDEKAGSLCGIEPVWASEVEPYPIAVTKERFPGMKHLGNICLVNGAEIEPVDIITFGSPCQDLSVAGKRAGLKHEANGDEETTRSGLFMEAVRIIKEMREATDGIYPRFALWENVPGAFSSNKGEDFRIVLEEIIRIVEPGAVMPEVPQRGWAYADSYIGDGWSLAYRVFDAQYWGVPQRRRRIHLVVDFRGGCAGKILFEREGVRGDLAESGAEREGTAGDAENGAEAADREGTPYPLKIRFQPVPNILLDDQGGRQINVRIDGKSPTLKAEMHGNVPCVMETAVSVVYDARGNGDGKTVNTITGDHENRITDYTSVVCEYIPIHDQATRFSGKRGEKQDGKGNGMGIGEPGDPMNTLTSGDRHAVAYCIGNGQICQLYMQEKCGALNCMHDQQTVCYQDSVGALCARDYKGVGSQYVYEDKLIIEQRPQYIVRRLTPTECGRLQGFPDGWGNFPEKEDFTDEEYRFWLDVRKTHAEINGKTVREWTRKQMLSWYNKLHTDSSEYKMWGNGIALTPAVYCMQGIEDALKE